MVDDTTTNDIQLNPGDVQQLADAAQVVDLFARLRYATDDSVELGHAALGLDSAELRQQIVRIRRVGADPVGGDVVIYLCEVRALTVGLTQAIARRFRDRPEDALLVLSKDYETLDFVLVERELAPQKQPGRGLRQVMRPRTLSVHRRNPGPVALRVLKRFTCTESDSAFQWEKLRSAFTLAEWSEPYFNNRALFSDYYLTARLIDPRLTPAWAEDVHPIGREVLRHLSTARRTFSGQPEPVVRQQLLEPLFQSLGFHAVANPAGDSGLDAADYQLYAPGQLDKPVALAMTTVWNRNLDDADPRRDAQTPDEIPGTRVVNVLARAAAPWVIVTNGKLWRLYSTTAGNKVSKTYEIDLEEAVTAPDQETALKYWWLFFRRQAFTGFLDDLVQQSAAYARGLGERLKERTFTTIFPRFAAGFIQNKTSEVSDASLPLVFRATLTFLYRLMFILYAESLSLLPLNEERGYAQLSLARLKQALADAAGQVEDEAPARLERRYRTDSTALYDRLQRLFQAIDAGDAALNLPMYNGGLFSTATPEGRYLAEHAIPDRYLALGLDRLCRDVDDKTQALAMIDYKSLGVRQLGSIYEGLLEFKLHIAAEKLVVVKEKGKEIYLPAREAGSKKPVATVQPGDVYLENDKRERKATGSYYTPDYIVKYIVEHTVGPVLARKFEALRPRLHDAQRVYRQRKAQAEAKKEDPEKFWNSADMQQLADDCLDVKVLDPAMGSGHFLVEAVDFISDRLIEFLNAWSENPVWALLARTRQDILGDMAQQGVSIDAERLTRVSLLRRSVLKRCVYGVDLNGMAVELAKVSLWLDAFTLGAPLSFLDHHLKHGNSLIGARVQEVRDALASKPGQQLGLFSQSKFAGVMLATDLMRQVSFLSDNTAGQLQASQAAFRSARDHLAPYKRVLDVYTSRWFGNHPNLKKAGAFDPTLEFLQRADVEAWLHDPQRVTLPERDYLEVRRIGEIALQVAEEKRFFHWELEFPEVFFAPSTPGGQDVQLREGGGFDAVVGNPPYTYLAGHSDREFFTTSFSSAQYQLDTYPVFVQQAFELTRRGGFSGYIIPSAWTASNYDRFLREFLATQTCLKSIVIAPADAFVDATVETLVLVFSRDTSLDNVFPVVRWDRNRSDSYTLAQNEVIAPDWVFPIYASSTTRPVVRRIMQVGIPLADIADAVWGVKVYQKGKGNPRQLGSESVQKVFHSNRKTKTTHKPLLGGTEITRYAIDWQGEYVDYGQWLAEPRTPDWFAGERILVREVTSDSRIQAMLCTEEFVFSNSVDGIKVHKDSNYDYRYVLCLLNSNLISFAHATLSANAFKESFPKVLVKDLLGFPIFGLEPATSGDRRAQLATQARALYQQSLTTGHAALLAFVTEHLALGESDVIHDLLAFLAERMIELNQQKQAEVKRFLGWLEGRLKITPKNGQGGIDSLTGKTIIQGYLGDYQKGEKETTWADFAYRLHQNRGRFGISLEQVQGEIEVEYEKSLAVLRPVKRQLAGTDALIDQVVYQLYGLTDEEIAIVERPAYEQALGEAKAEVLKDKTLAADLELATAAIADRVLPAAQRLQAQVSLAAERARLDADLPGWHLFPEEVATFLLTAEYNITSLPDFLDFSTSVVSYAKAVETMLYHRLFVRFRAESGATAADCRNAHLQKFVLEGKPLTLGSMGIILASSHEAALRRFVPQLYPRAAQTFYGPAGVAERLQDPAAVSLRNQAAHDTPLTRSAARTVRDWALGILQYL